MDKLAELRYAIFRSLNNNITHNTKTVPIYQMRAPKGSSRPYIVIDEGFGNLYAEYGDGIRISIAVFSEDAVEVGTIMGLVPSEADGQSQ